MTNISPIPPRGPKSRIARLLPKLIALPIPDFEKVKQPSLLLPLDYPRRGWKRSMDEMDYHDKAIAASIDALTAVIELTLMFLESVEYRDIYSLRREPSYPEAAKYWIKVVCDNIILMETALSECWPDKEFGNIGYETEGVAGFIDDLNGMPDPEDSLHEGVSEADKCTIKMLSFWLTEIRRRGVELMNICVKSVDADEAGRLFENMAALRYPVR